MRVSQVAFDRFIVELPAPEPGYTPLADPEEVGHLVRFLWDYGTRPLLALAGAEPASGQLRSSRRLAWVPEDADTGALEIAWHPDNGSHCFVFETEDELRRFLVECPAISRAAILWPRVDLAKTFMRLAEKGDWRAAVDAAAFFARAGSLVTLQQLA